MNFIKKLKEVLKRGYATADEKAALKKEYEELDADTKDVASDDMEKVDDLPEESEGEDEDLQDEVEKSIKSLFDNKEQDLKKNVLDEVQKLLDEHKRKMEKGVGVYNEEVHEDAKRKTLNKFMREGIGAILAGQETKEFEAARKEMTTDSSGTPFAGYITDDELSAEIRHLQTQYGVAAREFTTVTVSKTSYKANNLATDVSVFWVDEAGSIKSTQAVLGQSSLEIKKLAAIITLTRELLQEQEIDFVSFLGSRIAEGFAQAEDEAFFIGDGTSTYGSFTGLLNNTNTNAVTLAGTTFASVTPEDFLDMQDETPSGALPNAKYYMHRSILNLLRKKRADAVSASDEAGMFLYQNPADPSQNTLWGYPIVLVEAMPDTDDTAADTAFALFGDLKKTTIRGIRGGIVADRFNAGTVRNVADDGDLNLITTDREAVRWITQVGYIPIIPTAVTRLKTAAASA